MYIPPLLSYWPLTTSSVTVSWFPVLVYFICHLPKIIMFIYFFTWPLHLLLPEQVLYYLTPSNVWRVEAHSCFLASVPAVVLCSVHQPIIYTPGITDFSFPFLPVSLHQPFKLWNKCIIKVHKTNVVAFFFWYCKYPLSAIQSKYRT